jgi:hypothetical protein
MPAYLLPTLIARWRRIDGLGSLFAINLLFGWTLVIWLGCLVLACGQTSGRRATASSTSRIRIEPTMLGLYSVTPRAMARISQRRLR